MGLQILMGNHSVNTNLLFPFFFLASPDLIIIEAGESLQKISPSIIGKSLTETFYLENEQDNIINYENLSKISLKGDAVLLRLRHGPILFRGTISVDNQGGILYLANPCVDTPDKIRHMNLSVQDFARHDTIADTARLLDTLEKKNNELKILAENSDLLHKIIDLAPQQIFLKDSQLRFLLVNKRMAEIFDADISEIIGKTDRDFWGNSEEVDLYMDMERKILASNQAFESPEEPSTRKDGKKCVSHVIKMPFTLASGEKCILGIAIDITDIKEAQQAKFEIASGVLHDIGNAVVGFGSYLTRIKRSLEKNNLENLENLAAFFVNQQPALASAIGDSKAGAVIDLLNGITTMQKQHQEEVRLSISEQLNIITHIQEILNIQRQYVSGYQNQERKPVQLRGIINDCMAMVFASIDKRNIAVSLDINAELPIIKGDRTKLMQVILNILKNSIEAIPADAEEKNIIINLYALSNRLILKIRDSGIGLDEYTASHIFNRGFTTKPTGTGLGLFNCKTIIESHGGSINITSDGPGHGALTTIEFKIQ